MGTINYKQNKYVTVGTNTDIFTTEIDEDFEELEAETIFNDYYKELTNIISKYTFEFLNVEIKSGYYDGFYIDFNLDYCFFDNYKEKMQVLKEITKLKNFLFECLENNMCVCFPFWCTTYLNYEESKKEIIKAMKQFKEDIKKMPTCKTYDFRILKGV